VPSSYYNTYDHSEKRHWVVGKDSFIYRRNDSGEFEVTDNSLKFRSIHARNGKAIAVNSANNDIYFWDTKWESWEIVTSLEGERNYYSCYYNWDMSIMCNDTSGYHWLVDIDEGVSTEFDKTRAGYLSSWEVKKGLWTVNTGNYYCYNYDFDTKVWNTHDTYWC